MAESVDPSVLLDDPEDPVESLRQALLRMTSTPYLALQGEIDTLQEQIDSLAALREALYRLKTESEEGDFEISRQLAELAQLVQDARSRQVSLDSRLLQLDEALRQALDDPEQNSARLAPLLIPVIHERARSETTAMGEAVAPIIGPAIRHQIREARQDIIDSLYPLIGQIIGKAISEAFRELTRNIDARLRRRMDVQSRLRSLGSRIRGVSEAELLLRDSIPYSVHHVFLVHRPSGLLLEHLSAQPGPEEDLDLISGMLTAIGSFVRDSFGGGQGELEEITYGDQRILLQSGQHAYLAIVLDGIEPLGYNSLLTREISTINLEHEASLKGFSGEMGDLPDFKDHLAPLLAPASAELEPALPVEPMGRAQKWVLGGSLLAVLLVLALLIFACIFTARLWPVAFPGASPTPSATLAAILPSLVPTATRTATIPPSPTATVTASPSPPAATELPATATPRPLIGMLAGNLNLRSGPGTQYPVLGVLFSGERVVILESSGNWYRVSWPVEGEPVLDGWIWNSLVEQEE